MKSIGVEEPAAEALVGEKQQRIYYIDWLRMLAIVGVFLIHSGNMFDMLYKPINSTRQTSWNTWCWLIVILYVGNKNLNFENGLLNYGGVASFPFYLLHFPVVVVAAYFVMPWHLNIIAAFVCISVLAFLGTLSLTDLLFMRLSGTRMVFGSKVYVQVVRQGIASLLVLKEKRRKIHREVAWRRRTRVLTGTLN